MRETITFERVKLIALRDKYLLAAERGRQYLAQSDEMPENTPEEIRSKKIVQALYQYQAGKAQGLAEGIDELFFIVDGSLPPIIVKEA